MALIFPLSTAWNKSTAFKPACVAMVGLFQNFAPNFDVMDYQIHMCCQHIGKPPTSRPPMALGWPVIENGAAPSLPILPVSK
jgi:hypothetical protein